MRGREAEDRLEAAKDAQSDLGIGPPHLYPLPQGERKSVGVHTRNFSPDSTDSIFIISVILQLSNPEML